jgi:SAM-dependent methyltransferase
MKHILHDWNDEDAIRILRHCHRVLPAGGRLLVVEAIVPPPGERGWAKLLDLEMLVLTPRGRERTKAEFTRLLRGAGFRLSKVVATKSPLSIVEAVKA